MKRVQMIVASIVAFLLSAILFIGNFFYRESVQRGSKVELHREKVIGDENVKEIDALQLRKALEWYDEQMITRLSKVSNDGLLLRADLIEHNSPKKKAVILVHGFRKEKLDMRQFAKLYHDLGYHVLLIDARGHGESEGGYYAFGGHDRLDIVSWIRVLTVDFHMEDIILHGNSMGAAAVLMTSGQALPEQVKGIIADSSFTTMTDELTHQLKHLYRMPGFPLIPITSLITKVRAGYFYKEVSPIEQVKRNDLPLFLIHGGADDLVPTWMGEAIYDVAGGNKELWIIPGVGHIKGHEMVTTEYEARIKQFLQRIDQI